jgi:hypothetical protein
MLNAIPPRKARENSVIALTSASIVYKVVIALIVTPDGFPVAYEVSRATPLTKPRSSIF